LGIIDSQQNKGLLGITIGINACEQRVLDNKEEIGFYAYYLGKRQLSPKNGLGKLAG
jgi:hypothetical protein